MIFCAQTTWAQKKQFDKYTRELYQELKLDEKNVDYTMFEKGIIGYYNIHSKAGKFDVPYGEYPDPEYDKELAVLGKKIPLKENLILINFDLDRNDKRMLVIDMKNKEVKYHTQTTHGMGSQVNGEALNFSNIQDSGQTSLGFMLTLNEYDGVFGNSTRVYGIDGQLNDKVFLRDIVIHPANVPSSTLGCYGYAHELGDEFIDFIKEGSIILSYFSKNNSLKKSKYLNKRKAARAKNKQDLAKCEIRLKMGNKEVAENSPEWKESLKYLVVDKNLIKSNGTNDVPNDSCSLSFHVNQNHYYVCDSGLYKNKGGSITSLNGNQWNHIVSQLVNDRDSLCLAN